MNIDKPNTFQDNDDKTIVKSRKDIDIHICPMCGTPNPLDILQKRDYRCSKCNLELAHLDYGPNETIRGIYAWLLPVGEVFQDRYQIKQVLGKGGFGATYLVDDLRVVGRHRALKEVPENLYDKNETALLSRLDHPAIPDIIDHMLVNGMQYLILKFGGSKTLGSERKASPDERIPLAKLLPWMRQLCDVLIYLHSQNPPIIHRDLKPENILLNEDDRIMLIDFGIAKAVSEHTSVLAAAFSASFSSPEQIDGTGTDERADIYSLGATFYALLTGKNPPGAFARLSGQDLMPPSELVEDVPAEVDAAILQSLSLKKTERQQSVEEFADALGYADLGKTRRLDEQALKPFTTPNSSPTSPSGRLNSQATKAEKTASSPSLVESAEERGGKPILLWVGGAVVLFIGIGLAYTFLKTPETGETNNHTATLPPTLNSPPTPDPKATPVVATPPKPTPPIPNPIDTSTPIPPLNTAERQLVELLPQLKQGDTNSKAFAPDLERLMEQFIPPIQGFPLVLSKKGIYRENDSISFKMDLPSTGFLHVFIFEPNGKAVLIFPSQYAKNNRVGPGAINLPNGKPPILGGAPFGVSWLLAFTVPQASNLYQQYSKDKTRNQSGLVQLRIWEVMEYLQDKLTDPETKVVGGSFHVCDKKGPCP